MSASLAIQCRKEARALLPWAAAVAVATLTLAFLAERNSGFPNFRYDQVIWLVMLHVAGVLAVAALSFGHEFAHDTLASLLVQPVDRRRTLWTKLLVTGTAVTTLAALGDLAYPVHGALRPASRAMLVWGPAVAGIGLVPVLTLLTRRPLGGVVFAIAIPGVILTIANLIVPIAEGPQALSITWYGTLAVCATGLLALLYLFPRLEVAGGAQARVRASVTPRATAQASRVVRRHWAWALVAKELRLQQMTMAVSGLYVLASIGILAAQRNPLSVGPTFGAISILHGFFVAVIAGSIASAEERHLGTLTGQALLPIAWWRQWLVKSGTALGLAALLAYGLPVAIMLVHRPADVFVPDIRGEYVVGVLLVCIAALYVSSLSSNTLWALLACFPAIGGSMFVGAGILNPMLRMMSRQWAAAWSVELVTPAMRSNVADPGWRTLQHAVRFAHTAEQYILMSATVGLALLVLYLAGLNHRSLDRSARAAATQIATIALFVLAAALVYSLASRIAWMMAGV